MSCDVQSTWICRIYKFSWRTVYDICLFLVSSNFKSHDFMTRSHSGEFVGILEDQLTRTDPPARGRNRISNSIKSSQMNELNDWTPFQLQCQGTGFNQPIVIAWPFLSANWKGVMPLEVGEHSPGEWTRVEKIQQICLNAVDIEVVICCNNCSVPSCSFTFKFHAGEWIRIV